MISVIMISVPLALLNIKISTVVCLFTLFTFKLRHIVTFIVLTDNPLRKAFHRKLTVLHFWAFGLFI